jgi:RNA polymerase sigma factor (sigma-70 family)
MRHSVQRSIKTSAGGLGPTRRFFADLFRWRQIHSASEFDELHGLWKKTRSKLLYDRMLYGSSYIVKGVASRLSRNPYDTDLLQEGYIGVMKGIEEYDASRKVHFGTFFSWKIRGEMGRYIQNNRLDRPVRLPVHLLQRDIHIKRERDRYIAEHGRAPNNKTLLAWIHRHDHTPEATKIAATMTLEHLKESAQRQGERAIRLEAFVGGDEQVKTFADIIGPIHHDYDTLILVRQLLQKLTEALKRILQQLHELVEIGTITRRASEFLCLRYGIGVARALTLEEIAQRYSCSRQNVQQQVAQTFAKLFK